MPLDEEVEELKKLSPRERIRRLKEIEKERREEIAAAEELMRDSERELSDEEAMRRKVPIAQVRATDFSTIAGESESAKNIWKTAHFKEGTSSSIEETTSEGSELERTAQREAPGVEAREEQQKGINYKMQQRAERQGELYGRQREAVVGTERPGTSGEEESKARDKYLRGQRR